MKRLGSSLLLLCVLVPASWVGAAPIADHTSVDASAIPDPAVAAAANLRVALRRASVGGNISDGLDALHAANARYDRSRWIFYDRGNPGWQEKVDEFVSFVAGNSSSFDVLSMKFCFIDPNASFTYYRDALLGLESTYPTKTFVWWTIPLEDSGNTARRSFNDQVRAYAAANDKPLFDIADIESHDAAGNHVVDGSGTELLAGDWDSGDGGHLSSAGGQRVASAWWWLMARIAGWDPAGPQTLSVDDATLDEGDSGTNVLTMHVSLQAAAASGSAAQVGPGSDGTLPLP